MTTSTKTASKKTTSKKVSPKNVASKSTTTKKETVVAVQPIAKQHTKVVTPQSELKKEVITNKAASKKQDSKKIEDPDKPESKMDIAVRIYSENPEAKRGDLILRFMTEAGLTKAGASTYVQNIRKKMQDEK